MKLTSQAIIFLKATCPTLKHKNNNSDPYRIILKDVAKFANGHNCSKSRHLHEFKNWADCKVPDLCNVTNNPKRKIGDVIVLDEAIYYIQSLSGKFDQNIFQTEPNLTQKCFSLEPLHPALTDAFGHPAINNPPDPQIDSSINNTN